MLNKYIFNLIDFYSVSSSLIQLWVISKDYAVDKIIQMWVYQCCRIGKKNCYNFDNPSLTCQNLPTITVIILYLPEFHTLYYFSLQCSSFLKFFKCLYCFFGSEGTGFSTVGKVSLGKYFLYEIIVVTFFFYLLSLSTGRASNLCYTFSFLKRSHDGKFQ